MDATITLSYAILKRKIRYEETCVHAAFQVENSAGKGCTSKTASKILQSGYIAKCAIYPL